MDRWAPHLFDIQACHAGLTEDEIAEHSAFYERASELGVAPLLTLRHLAESCGVEYQHLRSRCRRRQFIVVDGSRVRPYYTFSIKKRSGGRRVISVPAPDVLRVQSWINHNILRRLPLHHRAFAYRSGVSIADCASVHLGCRWLIKLDLSRFFESITERQVYRVFERTGYPPLIAFEMARLCTRVDKMSTHRKVGPKWESNRREHGVPEYAFPYVGYLPQGAPTSPRLSNAVARDMDGQLEELAAELSWQYTRYSDDLYLSSSSPQTTKRTAINTVRGVQRIVEAHGFLLNGAKTRIAGPGHRKLVLGILVDGDRLRLSREFRRRVEWHVRHCLQDPASHAVEKGFDSVAGLRNHVEGLLAFARSVDPDYASRIGAQAIVWPVT